MADILTPSDLLVAAKNRHMRIFRKKTGTMEAVGVWHSMMYVAAIPRAGAANAAGMSGATCTGALQGAMRFIDVTGGKTGFFLGMDFAPGNLTASSRFMFIDRLWHNSGLANTTLTAQTVNSVTLPARDNNGTTNGEGVGVALEISATMGNGAAITTITLSYTNSDGVSGRTATIDARAVTPGGFPASATAGSFIPFTLQAGDKGVRSIQSITLGTSLVSGTAHLVMYRMIYERTYASVGTLYKVDPQTNGLVKRYSGTCGQVLIVAPSTGNSTIMGAVYAGEF